MKYEDLKSNNQELKQLNQELANLIATTQPLLEAESKEVENKRVQYLLNSYAKTPEEEEALRVTYETASETYQSNNSSYQNKQNDINNEIYKIEARLAEESDDAKPKTEEELRGQWAQNPYAADF